MLVTQNNPLPSTPALFPDWSKWYECQSGLATKMDFNDEESGTDCSVGWVVFLWVTYLQSSGPPQSSQLNSEPWCPDTFKIGKLDDSFALFEKFWVVSFNLWCFNVLREDYYDQSTHLLFSSKESSLEMNILLFICFFKKTSNCWAILVDKKQSFIAQKR